MKIELKEEDFLKNITHVGFFSDSNIIIWNELIKDNLLFYNEKGIGNVVEFKYIVADTQVLLSNEDKSLMFLLWNDGTNTQVFYVNIALMIKKDIFKKLNVNEGIFLKVLIEKHAYINTYPYSFVFKRNLIFKGIENLSWSLLTNKIIEDEDRVIQGNIKYIELKFFIKQLSNASASEYLSKNELDNKELFKLILEEGKPSKISYLN